MKLSEAIRLGAMSTLKADGLFYCERDGATCAQGAALLAIGRLNMEEPWPNHEAFEVTWPWTADRVFCPACGDRNSVRGVIAHLNNSSPVFRGHDWSREQIADWVETLEPREESPVAQTEAAVARAPQEA